MNCLLVVIGTSLFILSIILILTGAFYRKKTSSESATEYHNLGHNEFTIIPLRLKSDSKIEGEINVSKGELQFTIEDFFGWIPQTPIRWKAGAYDTWKGNGNHKFKLNIKAGDYMFMLKAKPNEIEAKIEWSLTYYVPKLKRLVDLGLAFVEVSVPLLVTGIVL